MRLDDPFEELLSRALSATDAPDSELQQAVIRRMKERMSMRTLNRRFVLKPVLLALSILLVMSTTAFAIWNLLTPGEYAERAGYKLIAEAFASEDAIQVNQVVESGGYRITLLGLVSGQNLAPLADGSDIDVAKTYAVVSIEKPGGTMPSMLDPEYDEHPFFVSPLIKGYQPWRVNIATLGGGYVANVIDGVHYRLIECDSIEVFADRGVYLGVNSGDFCDNKPFTFDAESGVIAPNPEFDGVNALFELPLDPAKADPVKAAEYLHDLPLGFPTK